MTEGPNADLGFEGNVKSLNREINIFKRRTLDKRNMVFRVPIFYLVTELPFFSLMSISGHLCTALNVKRPKSIANEYQCSLQF
jgi:Zn-finger domain-containing protein